MIRRHFLAGFAAGSFASASQSSTSNAPKFKLKYGPHTGQFEASAGKDMFDQMKFAADQGFRAWEDNGALRHTPDIQDKMGSTLQSLGMTMGVFVTDTVGFGDSTFISDTSKEFQDKMRESCRTSIECAKRLGAKWTTVVCGAVNNKLDPGYQTANCIVNLRAMAEVFEPAGLVMVIEPLNWYANHPGLFLRSVPQAYAICKGVNSPSCKILDDLYHQQIGVGNLIPNISMAWDEIPYYQTGDNPGRREPGTGEVNFKSIFKYLHERGYDGVIGMEHGKSIPGIEGEKALIAAYRECDSF